MYDLNLDAYDVCQAGAADYLREEESTARALEEEHYWDGAFCRWQSYEDV